MEAKTIAIEDHAKTDEEQTIKYDQDGILASEKSKFQVLTELEKMRSFADDIIAKG